MIHDTMSSSSPCIHPLYLQNPPPSPHAPHRAPSGKKRASSSKSESVCARPIADLEMLPLPTHTIPNRARPIYPNPSELNSFLINLQMDNIQTRLGMVLIPVVNAAYLYMEYAGYGVLFLYGVFIHQINLNCRRQK